VYCGSWRGNGILPGALREMPRLKIKSKRGKSRYLRIQDGLGGEAGSSANVAKKNKFTKIRGIGKRYS